MGDSKNDFVVVANRLPVDMQRDEDGSPRWVPSPGGLVSALSPVLESHRGCWVGWPGVIGESPEPFRTEAGVLLFPVTLSAADYRDFYEGFSNATLWPLYHDLIVTPEFHREWWAAYREVNLTFAQAVARVAAEGATVWVQDYQLQLVPGILRQMRPDLTIGFFLHIPFPSPDLFRQLPWREEVMRGLLGADVIGFHLEDNARNFLTLAAQVSGTAGSHTGLPDTLCTDGEVSTRAITAHIAAPDGRRVGVGAFPISIDITSIPHPPADSVAALRRDLGDPDLLLLGVDRLDYTKGILQRLRAYEELLEGGALPPKTVFLQIATPSRERIEHYRRTRSRVEEAVGRINGQYGTPGHPVVEYLHRSVPKATLATYYAAADIMLVTPFKDGMNLVAKEYAAAHPDGSGALVLSEFAGAAEEFPQAYLCNPFDLEAIKRGIHQAATDLRTAPDDARARMTAMHRQVREHDVDLWAQSFLGCLARAHDAAATGA
ncbi:trehalose-6-phosphate synthase [Corynebacterium sp. zg-331]|uniref:alpha,alpha-trehalose-phosphate synthase (UDP-forming) n=1 Tax=unclassified Corynebacterium TaxID=2624378 RepID=UPI00128DE16F|nr:MULTISPECIES: trehalose-6-phosphate synthase [unclassified Corynebacterium]MBC3185673.1 trehalose-6-phosphate synthase [Corynebacterium sp. zg-331]MPV52166.1 trehalose-6-phosphate synthase [Corynebacterium sp. zg331]